jgi:abortive infection bacteriophage resistance protein
MQIRRSMTRHYTKPALTWRQQTDHLRANGLEIDDDAKAEYWLKHVSYYRLSAYWLYFEHPKDHEGLRFRPGTTFDRVTALYDFDRILRRLIMRGTEHVEVALRGSWAYELAQIGDGHSYLDASLYGDRRIFHANLSKLAGETGRSRETYIKHYCAAYDVPALPPVWMVAEMMSFGHLSRWYSSLADRALRNRIARRLGLPETVMVPFTRHVTDIRNICAHHGRLWNRGFLIPPKLAQKPDDLRDTLDQSATQAPAKLYNAACLIGHVVRTVAPNSTWRADLAAHIDTHPESDLAAMGFPIDWMQRPMWR